MSNSFPHTTEAWKRLRNSLREYPLRARMRQRIGMMAFHVLAAFGGGKVAGIVWPYESAGFQAFAGILIYLAGAGWHLVTEIAESDRSFEAGRKVGFREANRARVKLMFDAMGANVIAETEIRK